MDLDLRRRRDALPGAIRWQRPDTEPAGKSEADKSTKISITGGAPLVVIRTERKAWGEARPRAQASFVKAALVWAAPVPMF